LSFISNDNEYKFIDKANINGIYKMSSGIVAVADASLIKVFRDDKKNWKVEMWKALPGHSYKSWLQKDGNLFVFCADVCLTIDPDGTFKVVEY
jgi:hypothetical protein